MEENASVENNPIALITISAPAYQSRCARSNCGAGVAATDGTDDRRVARKSRRRLRLLASSAPAVTAARRSCSENCMKILRPGSGHGGLSPTKGRFAAPWLSLAAALRFTGRGAIPRVQRLNFGKVNCLRQGRLQPLLDFTSPGTNDQTRR